MESKNNTDELIFKTNSLIENKQGYQSGGRDKLGVEIKTYKLLYL